MPDPATALTTPGPADPPPPTAVTPPADPPAAAPPQDPPPAAPPADPPPAATWLESLPQEMQGNDKLTAFDSVESLARAHLEAPAAPVIPNSDGYELPEGVVPSDFGEWAHKLNMTQQQVTEMIRYNQAVAEHQNDYFAKEQESNLNGVYEEWGESKQTNLSLAQRALQQFDTKGEFAEYLDESRAGNNHMVVKFLHTLGKQLEEDGFLQSAVHAQKTATSAASTLYPDQGKPEK